MKRSLLFTIVLSVAALSVCAKQARADIAHVSSPNILIINSYQADTDWSKQIMDEVVKKLDRQYPDIHIHIGHMNLDTYTLPTSPIYTLRSILSSYSDTGPPTVMTEDIHANTLFASGDRPDVLVFIGEDALLFYQTYGPWLKQWRDVPIVACGVSDAITDNGRIPYDAYDYNSLVSIEARRTRENFVPQAERDHVDERLRLRPAARDGQPGYLVTVDYNLTGVKSVLPIRENMALIQQLVPGLEEIIWIDNVFYSAQYAQWLLKKELATHYPHVGYTEIAQNRVNTDSIYNEILKPGSYKVYLSYSWDINGTFSKQNTDQIHTLFKNYANVPLFSLTLHTSPNPHWVGGYYRPYSEFADKAVKQISGILQGEPANNIPFETVDGGQIMLDQPLLKKYGLWNRVRAVQNVQLLNVPPTYYEENEKMILVFVIIGAILAGLLAYGISRNRYTRKVHKEYIRYLKLYNKLHLIYGHTSIEIALYDETGKLISCTARGREQLPGSNKSSIFSDNLFENRNLSRKLIEQLQNDEPVNSEVTVEVDEPSLATLPEKRVYQLLIKPLNEANSQSAKYVTIAVNLNQVVHEREERERFENLVRFASDSSQVGIAFYNIETAVGTATDSWHSNLNELIVSGELPTYKHVVPEDRRLLLNYREDVRNGKAQFPFNRDIRVMDGNGEEHWITQHIFMNVSDRKMLIELNLNVDEQKRSESVLLSAKKKVERSIVETQEFLANINHEIRTPLNSIVGFSAILAASESEEERKEHISLILKNNKLLTMLIDDVIELSKIDSGQTTFGWGPVKVDDLFRKVMMTGYATLYDKQLSVVIDSDEDNPTVYTDSEALFRLLKNLLSNAIKFTEKGCVTLGYRMENDRYYFFVKDTGCGIDPKNRKRIFRRFDKLDSYIQGTGLGLAVCKSIVEHLGGEIDVESEIGKGSTFWFTLPAY